MAYKVLGMLRDGGLGKDMHSGVAVPYQSARDRVPYLVTVQNGQLRWQFAPLDTGEARFLYVMDGDGNIYTADHDEVQHHSAFLAGQPAASAGLWSVSKGVVQWMNSESGHYQPPADYCRQIIDELRQRGVSVDSIETDFGATSDRYIVGMKKRAGITGLKWWQIERGGVVVKDYAPGITVNGAPVETGSHIQGQRMRLYPGKKPEWSWF